MTESFIDRLDEATEAGGEDGKKAIIGSTEDGPKFTYVHGVGWADGLSSPRTASRTDAEDLPRSPDR